MCSGCSGSYESDGEAEELRADARESEASDALASEMTRPNAPDGKSDQTFGIKPGGIQSGGIQSGHMPALPAASADEYDVFVSEDRIVEVRRIGRSSPAFRHFEPSELRNRAFLRQSETVSANRYGTPDPLPGESGRACAAPSSCLKENGLGIFERFSRTVRRLLR
jgi:hypothetical protein